MTQNHLYQVPAPSASQQDDAASARRCPACAAELAAGARFCRECGGKLGSTVTEDAVLAPLADPPASPTKPRGPSGERASRVGGINVQTRDEANVEDQGTPHQVQCETDRCPCGRTLTADALFCPGCGTRLDAHGVTLYLARLSPNNRSSVRAPLDGEVVIGKAPECDLVIADDDFVSRRHARVFCQSGDVIVEDLGSSNGTCVRMRRSFVLAPGDELLIGRSVFRLEQESQP